MGVDKSSSVSCAGGPVPIYRAGAGYAVASSAPAAIMAAAGSPCADAGSSSSNSSSSEDEFAPQHYGTGTPVDAMADAMP